MERVCLKETKRTSKNTVATPFFTLALALHCATVSHLESAADLTQDLNGWPETCFFRQFFSIESYKGGK